MTQKEFGSLNPHQIIAWVESFNVHARPSATAVIKEINPLLLKTYAVAASF